MEIDMRKSFFIVAALCTAFASGSAFAATKETVKPPHQGAQGGGDGQDMGTITAIDATNGTITLADGNVYKLPGFMTAQSVHVGEMVTVAYSEDASGQLASVKYINQD